MWPNDADGNAIRGALGPLLEKAGYTIVDPGAYQDGTNDYSAQIAKFKAAGLRDLQHVPDPARLRHLLAPGRAAGLPSRSRSRRSRRPACSRRRSRRSARSAYNLASGAYWTPTWPYTSSLTGVTNEAARGRLHEKTTASSGTSSSAPSLALFDVGAAALKASGDPKDKATVANAMKTLRSTTPVGHLALGQGARCRTSSQTPIIGGQWVKATGGKFKLDFVLCEHSADPNVPIAAKLKPYSA